ncbi:hypothetical protein HN958_03885 [Candidatus Falkowbacteria bacterium]|nr:hypothetical protein [Candidatus Falkowbacteria bacterium]
MMKSIILAMLCVVMAMNPVLISVSMADDNTASEVIVGGNAARAQAQQRQPAAAQPMSLEQVHQMLLTEIAVTQGQIDEMKRQHRTRRALNRLQQYRQLKQREFQLLKAIDRAERQMDRENRQRHRLAQSEVPRRRASSRSGDRVDIDNTTNLSVILETDNVANAIDRQTEELKTEWYETWWFWTIIGVVVVGGTTLGTLGGMGYLDGKRNVHYR